MYYTNDVTLTFCNEKNYSRNMVNFVTFLITGMSLSTVVVC